MLQENIDDRSKKVFLMSTDGQITKFNMLDFVIWAYMTASYSYKWVPQQYILENVAWPDKTKGACLFSLNLKSLTSYRSRILLFSYLQILKADVNMFKKKKKINK